MSILHGINTLALAMLLIGTAAVWGAPPVRVSSSQEFHRALDQAQPGTTIHLAPGTYAGGIHFSGLQGTAGHPIVITATDPDDPPVFTGSRVGLHLTDPAYLELRHLVFTGASDNGINIDDGGSFASPAHHIVLEDLRVTDIGPNGNCDAIKLSGVVDFRVENGTIERWGIGGGSGIDMVGCHRGIIRGMHLSHTDTVRSTGIQGKGGTSQIVIQANRFEQAGGRAINIGGSTGLSFFRPPLQDGREHAEAADIRVEGNTFIGGGAAVAFVGVDGATVRHNTIYRPQRWVIRILQETQAPGFVPSRQGVFTDNLVVFHSSEWASGGVNIGPHTAPETFQFERNWWFCLDRPDRSRPTLPVPETGGTYGQDPLLRDPAHGNLGLRPGSPARAVGASAFHP